MEDISKYLEKFKKFGFKERIIKDLLIEIIHNRFKIELKRTDLDLKESRIKIDVSGPLKGEIFLNKAGIIDELNHKIEPDKPDKKTITDIF